MHGIKIQKLVFPRIMLFFKPEVLENVMRFKIYRIAFRESALHRLASAGNKIAYNVIEK